MPAQGRAAHPGTGLKSDGELLSDVKSRIRQAQTRAVLAVNSGLVHLYWDIGRLIAHRQQQEGWGEDMARQDLKSRTRITDSVRRPELTPETRLVVVELLQWFTEFEESTA